MLVDLAAAAAGQQQHCGQFGEQIRIERHGIFVRLGQGEAIDERMADEEIGYTLSDVKVVGEGIGG